MTSSTDSGCYVPHQHRAKPQGCDHDTIFASVELWADSPPNKIRLGEYVYVLESSDEPKESH